MGLNLNSKIVTDSLVFAVDVANPKSINASGCIGYNNAPQLVKNLVSPSDTITATTSNMKLDNLSYFTAFAIDYPESSYGGAAASRHGITPGFNVTSGTKDFSFGRALNFWIYDSAASNTIKSTVYDTYASSSEVDRFVTEYNDAKGTYRGSRYTYLVAGSHRDSNHSEAEYTALKDMGAPSNVGSIINNSAPEWILVGRPGIGAGNGAWSYQNYSTNPDQVAHLNFAVPFQGNSSNYLSFVSGDRLETGITSFGNNTTWEAWIYPTANISTINMFMGRYLPYFGFYGGNSLFFSNWVGGTQQTIQTSTNLSLNNWYHATFTIQYDGTNSTMLIYTNGVQTASGTFSGAQTSLGYNFTIGDGANFGWYPYQGRVSSVKIYNKALSATEVQQNFNALRRRYGI